jgi:hypothetical protein
MIWLKTFFLWVLSLFGIHPGKYHTLKVNEALPSTLKKNIIYIVEEDGYQEQAAMLCPCGCKRILHMNLLPDERPCWKVEEHKDGSVSLYPSVWRKTDCRSHFWFKRGKVVWVVIHGDNCQ